MSEIEKLYENVGISKRGKRDCTTCEYLDCQNYCLISENNKCAKFKFVFPDFTAEKQLELIKWLIQEVDNLNLWYFSGKEEVFDFNLGIINAKGATFEETLAKIINNLWQDLTEEEKEQIKEILNG